MGPYGESAWRYRAAGWSGVLPLPAGAKWPPPRGYTGWAGVEPSGADVQAWCDGGEAAGNVALRLPAGVYGLDVDDYGGKTGATALERLIEAYGPLPPTWVVSSREESASGIRFYRAELAVGTRWRDEPAGHGAGVEAIHLGHRYAVVAPSLHPEGRKYRWRRPDGIIAADDEIPTPADLPALPAAWVAGLAEVGEVRTGEMAGHGETVEVVTGWRAGDPCPRVRLARERALGGLSAAAAGAALHPAAVAAIHELVNLGHEGHAGPQAALAEHFNFFVEVRDGRAAAGDSRRAAEGEWWRMVRGAIGKLPAATRREVCDCELWSGAGVQFDWTPPTPAEPATEAPSSTPDAADAMTAELLTPAQLAARPDPVPLVDGLLYLDTLAWLIGRSGSFKSFVALDMAARVAGGLAWAGRPVLAGPVLYLVAEGAGGMGLRVRAWIERYGPMTEALRMLPRPIQARGAEWGVLVEVARRLRPVLVVVDTQARVTVGIKENDNAEMGQFIEQVDRLRRSCGACVLIVHHIGRQGEDARGASAIDGAQDTELKLERIGGPRSMRARLVVDKQKDAPDTEAVDFAMEAAGSSLVVVTSEFVDPFPAEPWREGLPENQGLILSIMRGQFSEHGGTRAEVASVLRERGQRGEVRYRRSTFYDAWNALLKKDLLGRVPGSQRFVVVDPDDR